MGNYGQGSFTTANQQYNESAKQPMERDPDGLCNLMSQSVERASSLNESLEKLNSHLTPVLLPEPPEPSTTQLGIGANKPSTSSAHDAFYAIMLRLEQAERQISGIAARFKA